MLRKEVIKRLPVLIRLKMITFFIAIISIMLFANCNPTLKDSTSVNEAKKAVDYFFNDFNNDYEKLCKKPRNENTHKEFLDLALVVQGLKYCGSKCINLPFSDQKTIDDYAIEKFTRFPHLKKLSDFEIECWQ